MHLDSECTSLQPHDRKKSAAASTPSLGRQASVGHGPQAGPTAAPKLQPLRTSNGQQQSIRGFSTALGGQRKRSQPSNARVDVAKAHRPAAQQHVTVSTVHMGSSAQWGPEENNNDLQVNTASVLGKILGTSCTHTAIPATHLDWGPSAEETKNGFKLTIYEPEPAAGMLGSAEQQSNRKSLSCASRRHKPVFEASDGTGKQTEAVPVESAAGNSNSTAAEQQSLGRLGGVRAHDVCNGSTGGVYQHGLWTERECSARSADEEANRSMRHVDNTVDRASAQRVGHHADGCQKDVKCPPEENNKSCLATSQAQQRDVRHGASHGICNRMHGAGNDSKQSSVSVNSDPAASTAAGTTRQVHGSSSGARRQTQLTLGLKNGSLTPAALLQALPRAVGTSSVEGQYVVEDFISPEEEQALLAVVETPTPPWKPARINGPVWGKRWGVQTDLSRRTVSPAALELPRELYAVAERMRSAVPQLAEFHPNEANAILYRRSRGDYLLPHVDDRQLSKGPIVTLSLQGSVYMTLSQEHSGQHLRAFMQCHHGKSAPEVSLPRQHLEHSTTEAATAHTSASTARESGMIAHGGSGISSKHGGCSVGGRDGGGNHACVLLRPRALQLLTGRSRFNYTHGICADHVLDERRVSISFRYSPLRAVR